jgi:hypothetical protein
VSRIRTSTPRLLAALARIEGDGGGVAALLALDDLDAEAIGPDLELPDGAGAEGVARAEQDGARRASARLLQGAQSLAMLVVLPTPLTPVTRMTVGPDSANLSVAVLGGPEGLELAP